MPKISVTVSELDTKCDHCGTKMSRGFCLKYLSEKMYIGRMCLEDLTGVRTSGNPHRAAIRVELSLNKGNNNEDSWEAIARSEG